MGGARTAFLRNPGPGSVLERELQQDYYDWLSQGPLYGAVAAEVSDRSHGRVDILVRIGNVSFSVECKRELKDASADGLRAYLGQAAVYTNTSAALGILLVLDLTTPPTGAPDLFSSIWVEQVQREREEEPRHIVVARLPGNAPAPSATRTPAFPALLFEDEYTDLFVSRFRRHGVTVKYERDRAARDIGIHLTAPGSLDLSDVRVWFQLKGPSMIDQVSEVFPEELVEGFEVNDDVDRLGCRIPPS